jgi:N-glycosylase/DNA lyase
VRVVLAAPANFSFQRTLLSHGWCLLPPFRLGADLAWIETVVAMPHGEARLLRISAKGARVVVESPAPASAEERGRLTAAARRILNLDLDLTEFHARLRDVPGLAWIAEVGAGRLLRSPTVFEDLVKLVLTTNCSWSLTTKMVDALVRMLGAAGPEGRRAFPAPAAIAAAGERSLREQARTGYRAPYLADLAGRVVRGEIDPEAWERPGTDAKALEKEMLGLPGVGPYVAENLLKILGRPRGLALDSWNRKKIAGLRGRRRVPADRTFARWFAPWGEWAGLALWLEATADWHGDVPSWPR